MTVVPTDRAEILAKRRELRKAKKVKGKEFKTIKKRDREEKKKQIQQKIRDKREAERLQKEGKSANDNGCWLCGGDDHRKQDCPNREAGDLTKTCFKCRRRGHTSQNCPSNGGGYNANALTRGPSQPQKMVCFNCGSSNHALRDCREPRVNGGASYATCFVCNQTGHLSSQCPQSKTGIYPKGGCCKVCKSVNHLARDCPVGKISMDGGALAKQNKKTTFDEEPEQRSQGVMDEGGDALDPYDLDDDEDEDGGKKKKDDKTAWGHKKNKHKPRRGKN